MKLNKRREKNGDKRYGDCKKHMISYFNSHNNYNMCSEIPVHTIRTHPVFPSVCLSSVKLSKVTDLFSVVMNLIKYLCRIKTLPLLGGQTPQGHTLGHQRMQFQTKNAMSIRIGKTKQCQTARRAVPDTKYILKTTTDKHIRWCRYKFTFSIYRFNRRQSSYELRAIKINNCN